MKLRAIALVKSSWEIYRKNPFLFTFVHVGLFLFVFLAMALTSAVLMEMSISKPVASISVFVSLLAGFSCYISGSLQVSLSSIEKAPVLTDIISSLKFVPRMMGGLFALLIIRLMFGLLIGMVQFSTSSEAIGAESAFFESSGFDQIVVVAFLIPCAYILMCYMFAPCFIVDKGAGIIESFKLSNKVTKGRRLELFLVLCGTGLVYIIASLGTFFVGY